ncbi:hypothetical protein EVAR_98644_1 [Eumeta japonica]|uniref:Uncharacterized protein n=1 Tax=Eumeta variegata TaxID=151549 RepID=A0A4C1XWQ6_EUMVA|nr:hypothetical protein EVAR_98644_1 [Eumeta japonica]
MSRAVGTHTCRPAALVGFSPTLPTRTGARVCGIDIFYPLHVASGKQKKKLLAAKSSVRALGPNGRPRAPAPSALSTILLHIVFSVQTAAPLRPATLPALPTESPLRRHAPQRLIIYLLFQIRNRCILERAPGAGLSPSGNGKPRTDLIPPVLEGAPSRHQRSNNNHGARTPGPSASAGLPKLAKSLPLGDLKILFFQFLEHVPAEVDNIIKAVTPNANRDSSPARLCAAAGNDHRAPSRRTNRPTTQ